MTSGLLLPLLFLSFLDVLFALGVEVADPVFLRETGEVVEQAVGGGFRKPGLSVHHYGDTDTLAREQRGIRAESAENAAVTHQFVTTPVIQNGPAEAVAALNGIGVLAREIF